jgi:hypothetical protein
MPIITSNMRKAARAPINMNDMIQSISVKDFCLTALLASKIDVNKSIMKQNFIKL